jgi:hypothetical protein
VFVSAVAVDFDRSAETVDLTWSNIGDEGMRKLAWKLQNSACTTLILSRNSVSAIMHGTRIINAVVGCHTSFADHRHWCGTHC